MVIQETFDIARYSKEKNPKIAIVPFNNYTETPVAGYRAASIIQSVMRNKGHTTYFLAHNREENDTSFYMHDRDQELLAYLEKAEKQNIPLLLSGSVEEWRYKTGIDGEPAVSYSIFVYNTRTKHMVFSSVGAKSGWGHESLGVIAQKIGQKLIE